MLVFKCDLHFPKTSFLATSLAPGQVREVAVGGAGDDGAVEGLELLGAVVEGDDLGGTDKGEVEGVEEENHVLPLVVIQRDLLELTVNNSSSCELWSGHLRLKSHDYFLVSSLSETN